MRLVEATKSIDILAALKNDYPYHVLFGITRSLRLLLVASGFGASLTPHRRTVRVPPLHIDRSHNIDALFTSACLNVVPENHSALHYSGTDQLTRIQQHEGIFLPVYLRNTA